MKDVVVIGTGLAGVRCAETLRAEGFDGRIVVVGEERHAPYERPALSKELLAGTRDDIALRTPFHWHELGIELVLGARVERVRDGVASAGSQKLEVRPSRARDRSAATSTARCSWAVPASSADARRRTRSARAAAAGPEARGRRQRVRRRGGRVDGGDAWVSTSPSSRLPRRLSVDFSATTSELSSSMRTPSRHRPAARRVRATDRCAVDRPRRRDSARTRPRSGRNRRRAGT